MDTAIFYISIHHGNTEKIARAMGEVLEAKLIDLQETEPGELQNYDLLGFGSGIYYRKHHKKLLELVEALPELSGKSGFIFSTSGLRQIPLLNPYHHRIKQLLTEKNIELTGEFTCRGYDTFGPLKLIGGMWKGHPNEEDLERARSFAARLKRH